LGWTGWWHNFVSQNKTTTMKKILTLIATAIIFISLFANASTSTTGNVVKTNLSATVKTSNRTNKHYTIISAKRFSIKRMQDIK
jgi:hypothetical protein